MPATLRSLRIPPALERDLERELARRGQREWSAGLIELLDEAIRMTRVPGIVFVDARGARRAALAHSGLEVWEVIATWREGGERWDALRAAYPELSDVQLRAALAYYQLYPAEVDERLAREAAWTPERAAAELPYTRPPVRAAGRE